MASRRTDWPPEKVKQLKALAAAGDMSIAKIAAALGESIRATRLKMQRLALIKVPDKWTDEKTARAIELWKQGFSAGRIAAELGVTRNAVIGRLNRLGYRRDSIDSAWRSRVATMANEQRKAKKAKKEKREGKLLKKPNLLSKLLELPLPPDDPDDIATTTVIDREPHQCAWPIKEPSEQKLCGREIVRGLPWGTPYCAKHALRAFRAKDETSRPFIVQSTAEALRRKRLREAGLLEEFVEPVKESA